MDTVKDVLAALTPLLGAIAGWAAGQMRAGRKRDVALERGVKMLLRAKIIDKCLHYIEKGNIPPYGLETIKGLNQSYLDLGDGDPSVGDLVDRVEHLQIRGG